MIAGSVWLTQIRGAYVLEVGVASASADQQGNDQNGDDASVASGHVLEMAREIAREALEVELREREFYL